MPDVAQSLSLPDESATRDLGQRLAASISDGLVIYLYGELGAGKTSFARALLQARGAGERIKSPTYSLVEPYALDDGRRAWHLDLYRVADPGELEWLGLEELGDPRAWVLVEWPERGAGALPAADLQIRLAYEGTGRQVELLPASARGETAIHRLNT